MPKDLAVIIPVHKEKMSPLEEISFIQCTKILKNRDIFLLIPESLSAYEYNKIYPNLILIKTPDFWFQSLYSYNLFKLSDYFYSLFTGYEFILTYELDAYIFKDDLDYWMSLNLDYIGAPWFSGYDTPLSDEIIGVGNSGFSLRKRKKIHNSIYRYFNKKSNSIFRLRINKSYDHLLNEMEGVYEDWFIVNRLSGLHYGSIQQSISFSFEVNPSYLFAQNKFVLPTGCHGWSKYEFNFWKPFIEQEHKVLMANIVM